MAHISKLKIMKNIKKIIKITLFCLISSFALASEEDITKKALFTPIHEIQREIAQTQQLFNSALKDVKELVATLEAPINQNLDPQTRAEAEELDEWVLKNVLPRSIYECEKYNMKLSRLKNTLNKKIELAEKEKSSHRLERMLADAQKRGIARRLEF